MGLATGLVELLVLLARRLAAGSSALGALQLNRHYPWMIPAAHLAIFAAVAVPLAILAAIAPRAGRRLAALAGIALMAFAPLSLVHGLHPAGAGLLAIGLAWRAAPAAEARAWRLRRLRRVALPAMLGVVGLLGAWSYDREVLREGRLLAAMPAPPRGTPNVLLLVLDTVRADHLSLYGYARPTTPNLERLARRGVVFREARSAAPWTLPSHASLLTGRWPHELNVGEHAPLDRTFPTLAERLAAHGYATAGFVANTYFCNSWFGLARGFAHYEDYYAENLLISPEEALRCTGVGRWIIRRAGTVAGARPDATRTPKTAERINADLLRWLDANPGRRFFAFLNYMDAHDPYALPPGVAPRFGDPSPTAEDAETIRTWSQFLHGHAMAPAGGPTDRERTLVRDAYDDCLAYLDDQLGRLFAELERRGRMDDTLVIVTSDHGEAFGEHGLYGHGVSLYRPELHVPLLIVGPKAGVPAGRDVAAPVSLRDIPATVVERLGLGARADATFPGRTLARGWEPSLEGTSTAPDDPVIASVAIRERPRRRKVPGRAPAYNGPMASVIVDGRTYIRDAYRAEELYDVAGDPGETRNRAGEPGSRPALERARATLGRFVPAPAGDPGAP
jgi:arylsulfatase A-like enzyme